MGSYARGALPKSVPDTLFSPPNLKQKVLTPQKRPLQRAKSVVKCIPNQQEDFRHEKRQTPFSFAFLQLSLTTCFSPLNNNGDGSITINLGGSRAAYTPDAAEIAELTHNIHLKGPDNQEINLELAKGQTSAVIQVTAGSWEITVKAYKQGILIAEDTKVVQVERGKDNSVSMAMQRVGNQTPVAGDYDIGKLTQTALIVTAVTITPKIDKSPGAVSNIRYNGRTTVPQTAGLYAVTFDVAAVEDWNAASGLSAGNLVVRALPMEMVDIPTGALAWPSATITLSAFKMGKYEVTQEQYEAVMGENPSYFDDISPREPEAGEIQERRPVECVSWYHAIAFCNRLSILQGLTPVYTIAGKNNADASQWVHSAVPTSDNAAWNAATANWGASGYRLPTEAQWEYACRATGTTTDWCFGDTEAQLVNYAWYSANANSKTHQVGKKLHNDWGLYDMHGNVHEWCWDLYGAYPSGAHTDYKGPAGVGGSRVERGGLWDSSAGNTRSAFRRSSSPDFRDDGVGFRVARN